MIVPGLQARRQQRVRPPHALDANAASGHCATLQRRLIRDWTVEALHHRRVALQRRHPRHRYTVKWSYASPTPLEIPGANLIFDALSG